MPGVLKVIAVVMLVGCASESAPEPMPDAREAMQVTDASTCQPSRCCALLPDVDAVRACETEWLNSGDCGVIVCFAADCTSTKIPFCVP